MMTRQEIFDTVVRGLLTQNQKCMGPDPNGVGGNICLYRDKNGCRCAIGFLIPDDRYKPDIEGLSVMDHRVDRLLVMSDALESVSDDEGLSFLEDLQQVHDKCDVSSWRVHLKDVGRKWELNISAL